MLTRPLVALLFLLAPALVQGQSEAALREYFEGRTVKVKIAMPGTEDGVDIYPGTAKPLDYPRHATRLKNYGTALKAGDESLVTKVKLKAKLIELQLDGGGYGTMGDETSSSVSVSSAPKTRREQNLEGELRREQDPVKRRAMKEELDDLRAAREREDARNHASVAEAEESKKANIRQRRLEGGSRFNIRYPNGVPNSALTPEAMKETLGAASRGKECSSPTWTACWARRPGPPSGWRAGSKYRPGSTRPTVARSRRSSSKACSSATP